MRAGYYIEHGNKLPPEEQGIYENYLEDLHLKASLAHTQKHKLDKAKKEGVNEGVEQGKEIGGKEKAQEMAKIMKTEVESIEKIMKYTKLSREEIEKL